MARRLRLTMIIVATLARTTGSEDVLSSRRRARASIHRGQFEASLELRAAGRQLGLEPLEATAVVVAMTTTPTRIAHIRPALESILNQSQEAMIVLNVPQQYSDRRGHWRGKRLSALPEWLDGLDRVVIHHVEHDWGPATKLIGTVVAYQRGKLPNLDDDAVVVAADDDHEWESYALATLVRHGFANASARAVWSYYTYAYPRREDPAVCVPQAGDMIAVRLGALRTLPAWGRELLPPGRLPNCFFVDDLFFAAYFRAVPNLPIVSHPWRFWLFKESKRRQAASEPVLPLCRGACSPVSIRLRYPDSLAMGPPRENHNALCKAQLAALGWWPTDGPPSTAVCQTDRSLPVHPSAPLEFAKAALFG